MSLPQRVLTVVASGALGLLLACLTLLLDTRVPRACAALGIGPKSPERAATSGELARLAVDPPRDRGRAPAEASTQPAADGAAEVAARVLEGPHAELRGRVVDQAGLGVAQVGVTLRRGRAGRRARTDSLGRFGFEDLENGLYRLYVDERSLPDGYLPPWRQHVPREHEDSPTGVFGTSLRVTGPCLQRIDLRVFEAGAASGRLIAPGGGPVAGALVTIHSREGIQHSARTGPDGGFAFDPVRPSSYSTAVELPSSVPGADASAPLPVRFVVAAGARCTLPDLVIGAGGHVLRGTVLDDSGRPVSDLEVTCEEQGDGVPGWRAVTDAQGRFELGRVPASALVVRVAPGEERKPEGTARVRHPVTPLRVDTLGAPDVVDLGRIEVDACRPFRFVARIHVDPTWAAAQGFERWSARIEAAPHGRRADRTRDRAHDEPSDVLSWSCATPRPPLELHVVLQGTRGAERRWRRVVHPFADGLVDAVAAFP